MSWITTSQKRIAVMQSPKYKYSLTWANKVKAMSDAQIDAIYIRFKKAGLLAGHVNT